MYRVFFPDGSWLVEESWGWDQTPDGSRAATFVWPELAKDAIKSYRRTDSPYGYGIEEL